MSCMSESLDSGFVWTSHYLGTSGSTLCFSRPFVKYVNYNHIMPTRYQVGPGIWIPTVGWVDQHGIWKLETKTYLTCESSQLPLGGICSREGKYPCVSFWISVFCGAGAPESFEMCEVSMSLDNQRGSCHLFWTHDDLIPKGNWSRKNLSPQIMAYGIE